MATRRLTCPRPTDAGRCGSGDLYVTARWRTRASQKPAARVVCFACGYSWGCTSPLVVSLPTTDERKQRDAEVEDLRARQFKANAATGERDE